MVIILPYATSEDNTQCGVTGAMGEPRGLLHAQWLEFGPGAMKMLWLPDQSMTKMGADGLEPQAERSSASHGCEPGGQESRPRCHSTRGRIL